MRVSSASAIGLTLLLTTAAWADSDILAWKEGQPQCRIIPPTYDEAAAQIARSTLSHYSLKLFGFVLPVAKNIDSPGNYIVIGTPASNPAVAKLIEQGVKLTTNNLGNEGFQILTHQHGQSRYIILQGNTPRAIKHACMELLFFRTAATKDDASFDWPMDIVKKPAFAYRGIYMLPCWSAQDSLESWQRVLRFNSELTINRNWFWLDGFPIAGHTGEYVDTALASESNVQSLINLCNAEAMKFLIGGGWFNFHHLKAVSKNYEAGRDYYLTYLKTFKNFHGLYIEPTGEGKEIEKWRPECDMLRELIDIVLEKRPDFEFAIAIGMFNNDEYLKLMSKLDPKHVYWWWCWGDPMRDKALDYYPKVLRWHLSRPMSSFHGCTKPPSAKEQVLAGMVTSYDPGQGFGNPWDGWARLGTDEVRNFDPYSIPYFGHQYHYRERCWDPNISEPDFVKRLHRRLFDIDAPAKSGEFYWQLTQITRDCDLKKPITLEQLVPLRRFVDEMKTRTFTQRTTEAVARMDYSLNHLNKYATPSAK